MEIDLTWYNTLKELSKLENCEIKKLIETQ